MVGWVAAVQDSDTCLNITRVTMYVHSTYQLQVKITTTLELILHSYYGEVLAQSETWNPLLVIVLLCKFSTYFTWQFPHGRWETLTLIPWLAPFDLEKFQLNNKSQEPLVTPKNTCIRHLYPLYTINFSYRAL